MEMGNIHTNTLFLGQKRLNIKNQKLVFFSYSILFVFVVELL